MGRGLTFDAMVWLGEERKEPKVVTNDVIQTGGGLFYQFRTPYCYDGVVSASEIENAMEHLFNSAETTAVQVEPVLRYTPVSLHNIQIDPAQQNQESSAYTTRWVGSNGIMVEFRPSENDIIAV